MDDSLSGVVSKLYTQLGGPGSFGGFDKLKRTLKLKGYKFNDTEVQAALNKIEAYAKYRRKLRTRHLPAHVPRRFARISMPGLWFFGDSMYVQKGWPGNLKFIQIWIDGFSRKLFARPLTTLNAKNTVKVFTLISEEDNDNRYPDVCYTDRGTEFLGEFSQFLRSKNIRQIFTSAAQKNKAFMGVSYMF